MVGAKDFKGKKRKILYYKFVFDKGFSLTGYLKYFLVAMGLVIDDVQSIFLIGAIYAILCFIIGYFWLKYRLQEAENDVANAFNPFVRRVERKLKPFSNANKFEQKFK